MKALYLPTARQHSCMSAPVSIRKESATLSQQIHQCRDMVPISQRLAYQTVTRSLIRPRPPDLRSANELLACSHSVNPNGLNWSMPSRWSVAKLQLSNRDWCCTVQYRIRASKRDSVIPIAVWTADSMRSTFMCMGATHGTERRSTDSTHCSQGDTRH